MTEAAGHYSREFSDAVIQAFMDQFDFETAACFQALEEQQAYEAHVTDGGTPVPGESAVDDDSDGSFELMNDEEQMIISPAVKAAAFRLHVNTAHRSPSRLARALLVCGAPKEAVLAARRLKCAVCQERRQPKARLPASLPPPREVGQQVHVDLVLVEDSLRQTHVVAHATDAVSKFQAAAIMKDKSTESFINFLTTRWLPLLGTPSTIVADQGREFISESFCSWCDSKSIYLKHIAVGAPWQNGIAERSGGTLKAVLGSITTTHFISTSLEMDTAVSEAVSAYNYDIHENGMAPIQCVTGRVPPAYGDVLNNFSQRLAEHSLIAAEPSLAKQVALRETARLAMIRLHYIRSLRTAELARSRPSTQDQTPVPGDLVFFWRAQKYVGKNRNSSSRRKLALRRWHGPGLLVALEGDVAANCFISYRGQLTKCPLEHVRPASSLESIAAGSWQAAIDEVIQAARNEGQGQDEPADDEAGLPSPEETFQQDAQIEPGTPVPSGLSPQEIVAASQPAISEPPASAVASRRSSLISVPESDASRASSAAPGTPVPNLVLSASQIPMTPVPMTPPLEKPTSLQRTIQRARSLDDLQRGVKRPPEDEGDREPKPSQSTASSALPAFEALALALSNVELDNLAAQHSHMHPLMQLQIDVAKDRRDPMSCVEADHGTWDGRWAMLCERDWQLMQSLGERFPNGEAADLFDATEVNQVQTARREYQWSKMTPEDKKLWGEAAVKGWMAYIDNEAIEVLSMEESRRVRAELARKSELDRILVPRFVCTDKNDGLRSSSSNLPVRHSARMVVPGFKDRANLEGSLRRDAPIGSRTAQHLLLIIAYSCMEPYMVFDLGRRQGCLSERRQVCVSPTLDYENQ